MTTPQEAADAAWKAWEESGRQGTGPGSFISGRPISLRPAVEASIRAIVESTLDEFTERLNIDERIRVRAMEVMAEHEAGHFHNAPPAPKPPPSSPVTVDKVRIDFAPKSPPARGGAMTPERLRQLLDHSRTKHARLDERWRIIGELAMALAIERDNSRVYKASLAQSNSALEESGVRFQELRASSDRLRAALTACIEDDGGLYDLGLRAGRAGATDAETDRCIAAADAIEAEARAALEAG